MPQSFATQIAARTASGTVVNLICDADGKLIIADAQTQATEYETVAAGQTDQVLGTTGAIGDLLESLTYIPASTTAGIVQIQDGADTAITLFVGGGTTALVDLRPVTIPLNLVSRSGAWSVTTGAGVSALATGNFT